MSILIIIFSYLVFIPILLYALSRGRKLSDDEKKLYKCVLDNMFDRTKSNRYDVTKIHNIYDWLYTKTDENIIWSFHCIERKDIDETTLNLLKNILYKPVQ